MFSYSNLFCKGLSKGWKWGIIPINAGRGIIGSKDLGSLSVCLGRSIRGGGIRCFETRISWDYSDSTNDWDTGSSYGESSLIFSTLSIYQSKFIQKLIVETPTAALGHIIYPIIKILSILDLFNIFELKTVTSFLIKNIKLHKNNFSEFIYTDKTQIKKR